MTDSERLNYLKIAWRVFGFIAIFGIYPPTVLWPSGWAWHSGRSEYLEMIIAIYAPSLATGRFRVLQFNPSCYHCVNLSIVPKTEVVPNPLIGHNVLKQSARLVLK